MTMKDGINNDKPSQETTKDQISSIAEMLQQFDPRVFETYWEARSNLIVKLESETLHLWGTQGVEIAKEGMRGWEVAIAYFEASASVHTNLMGAQFRQWGEIGYELISTSPSLASAYFKSSPATLKNLSPRNIADWVTVSSALYRGTWKSGSLACKLFQFTAPLLEHLSFSGFRLFGKFLEILSLRSYESANEVLESSVNILPILGKDSKAFIALAETVTRVSWREIKPLFGIAASSIRRVHYKQRRPMIDLAQKITEAGNTKTSEILRNVALIADTLPIDEYNDALKLSDNLIDISHETAEAFLKVLPSLLQRVTLEQVTQWHSRGIEATKSNSKSAAAYFALASPLSNDVLDALSTGVSLSRVRDILRMYCFALCGHPVEISTTENLVEKDIGWIKTDLPSSEAGVIYLPSTVNHEKSKEDNFSYYKVMATHQAGHIEFGSFEFEFDTASEIFENLRPEISKVLDEARQDNPKQHKEKGTANGISTEMTRFFALFPESRMSRDVFIVLESLRIDSAILSAYEGISSRYMEIQAQAAVKRPEITNMRPREALVEFMIRYSLGQTKGVKVPSEHKKVARRIRKIMDRIAKPNITVEDAAEAAIRIYALLSAIPDDDLQEDSFDEFDSFDTGEDTEETGQKEEEEVSKDFVLQQFAESIRHGNEFSEDEYDEDGYPEDSENYESPQQVDYRGEFKPELAQLMAKLQNMDEGTGGEMEEVQDVTAEQLQELLKNSGDFQPPSGELPSDMELGELSNNILDELARRDPQGKIAQQKGTKHIPEDGKPLEVSADNQYLYKEWDFRSGEYKPRWCLLHEKQMSEGEPHFYNDVLAQNASLVHEIKRQFEMIAPEMYSKRKRLYDGEETDFDAALEALIDIRVKVPPDEKIYWRRNKMERSVAVAFLLDMSASTAEAIEDIGSNGDDWGAPDDPVEYMIWLRSHRSDSLRRKYKRIVDIEKESVVLLVNALEMLGDDYGVYGFSGYGRENVEFYVIKDIDEKFENTKIPGRIDRIAPLHATRMGPAIRHTTSKLAKHDAKARHLFLISDGRPQDRGYTREGVEKEYAVHDTRMALMEARHSGIKPFCLTVDKSGHDYLKTMMDDFSYEVLPDVHTMPQRLLQLYKNLTS